jgi:Zn-dependent protease with chaperone function
MEYQYPEGPVSIPENLTAATSVYKRHAWLAMMGLTAFVVLYFALAGWFAWSSYSLITTARQSTDSSWAYWVASGSFAFLALFMLKALFFVKQGGEPDDIEVTAKEEPKLFEFLHRLADEAGAPRPHRVFLSAQVNAAVFYDLSLLNLIFPSKKNLDIGLALVNVLTLSELKAVLAHEFGHFAQRSMAVGRWVYIAQQIAAHIVSKRDALDKSLVFISSIDIRVAWIGWILRLIVWSIRSILETAFSLVVMAQRALSREMEFQADRVAVSLTGSDALIHALHKLQAADEAWDSALGFVNRELSSEHSVKDVFEIQTQIIQRTASILDDDSYGKVPEMPATDRKNHRIFTAEIAQPPRMWATHPHNHERENSAKELYVEAPLISTSAWVVFNNNQELKEQMSAHLIAHVEDVKPKAMGETLKSLDKQYAHTYLDRAYRGAYLSRSVVRHVEMPEQLYDGNHDAAIKDLSNLYPETLAHDLEELRNVEKEQNLLKALRDSVYHAPGGIAIHRGNEIKKHDLPAAIDMLQQECEVILGKIYVHDKRCRTAHRAAAAKIGNGWEGYLVGLVNVLHYAAHNEANLLDLQGVLNNVVAVIMADGNVSKREMKRLLVCTVEVYQPLSDVYENAEKVLLDETLLKEMDITSWKEGLGDFEFPPATRENINDWMQAVDGWLDATTHALSTLRQEALEQLLATESRVALALSDDDAVAAAPKPSQVYSGYATLLPGNERKLQKKLGLWDRFQTADGFFPSLLRTVVSGGVVGTALYFSATVGGA